ncbi:MAG: dodecin domain-containing protein [Chlorobia bacterium]|nr:dodecin domain-containing protein [Fimbriimonadaceae bacterium]
MSVAKVIEISSSSSVSFDDAIKQGVSRASKTVKNIQGAWIQDQQVVVSNNQVTEYRVMMKVTFILEG